MIPNQPEGPLPIFSPQNHAESLARDFSSPPSPPAQPVKPPVTYRRFDDGKAIRNAIFDKVLHTAQNLKPVQNQKYTLTLTDVEYGDNPEYNADDVKKAVLERRSLNRRLKGTWNLIDTPTGDVLQSHRTTVAQVPYMFNNGSIVRNGNKYAIKNQSRLKPGVYVRRKENGELVVNVNAHSYEGATHNYTLDQESGQFDVSVGNNKAPLVPFLRALGATDTEMKEAWGEELFNINKKQDKPAAVRKLYERFVRGKNQSADDTDEDKMMSKIKEAAHAISLSADVTGRTLKKDYDHLNKDVVLSATRKLIGVGLGDVEPDSRDELAYQTIWGPEDQFADPLEKDDGQVRRRLLQKLTFLSRNNPDLKKLPTNILTPQLDSVFNASGLAQAIEEINPYDVVDKMSGITRMGRGGIPSSESVPYEARGVNNSQFGFIDGIRTPESMNVGVDLFVSKAAYKGSDGNIYIDMMNAHTGEMEKVSPTQLHDKTIAIKQDWDKNKDDDTLPAFDKDKKPRMAVPRDQVDYILPHHTGSFSPVGNLVPMLNAVKGQRLSMASRMVAQALPLVGGESPLVQSGLPGEPDRSFEDEIGRFATVNAEGGGTVTDVVDNKITIQSEDGQKKTYTLDNYSPSNRKSYSHQTPVVQIGDQVKDGQLLARSNFTDSRGALALGRNLRTVMVPWQGRNHADAVIISQSAADKLRSQHMYQNEVEWTEHSKRGKNVFVGAFPGKYDKEQLEMIDDNGIIRKGMRVNEGDPLILRSEINSKPTERIHRKGDHTMTDQTVEWDHSDPGIVTDVYDSPKGTVVLVKTESSARQGDKLAARYGNKGVIAAVLPDSQMPQTEDGPAEIAFNTVGNISRVNPAAVHELTLGKIAKKIGEVIRPTAFDDIEDWAQYVVDRAKEVGVNIKESITDPETGKKIDNVNVGYSYIQKLHHSAESKESARAMGRYTADETPAKGSHDGAKRVALMHSNALVSHGAYNILSESKRIRGQKNDQYWSAFMRGYQPPEPEQPLVYKKFISELQGSGINVVPEAGRLKLMAMTDDDVKGLADTREVGNSETIRWEKDKKPIRGGLFDPEIFGEYGDRWGFIQASAPVLNPIMEEPARRMLGLTQAKLDAVIAGKESIGGYGTGPAGLQRALSGINIDQEIAKARITISSKRGASRDDAVKKLGFLQTAKDSSIHPGQWMLSRIPVIPPRFRAVSEMAGTGTPLVADANYLYKQLIDHNKSVKEMQQLFGDAGEEHLQTYNYFKQVTGFADPAHPKLVQKQVKGLMRHVFGDGSSKFGTVQRSLLGAPVDLVGRNTVVPDPDLDMDSVGIPIDSAFDIYKPFIVRKLTQRGFPLMKAQMSVENKDRHARAMLLEASKERPVIVDRAPLMHKYGVMAFWPKLVKGDVLHINPYVLGGYGMDFDGDSSNFQVPVSDQALREAKELMMPSSNAIDVSDNKSVMHKPTEDYILGLFEATRKRKQNNDRVHTFATMEDMARAFKRGDINHASRVVVLKD